MARLARTSLNSGPDFFGEEQPLSELATFLSSQGIAEEAIAIQQLQLTAADTSLQVRLPSVEETGDRFRQIRGPGGCRWGSQLH